MAEAFICDYIRTPIGRYAGAGKDWYDYEDGKARPSPQVNDVIAAERINRGVNTRRFALEAIQRRIVAVMANEGAHGLDEGISLRPSDIDLMFLNGYGFPRARGGPMFAADQMGLAAVLAEVEQAARVFGAGSEPAPLLVRLAREGASFAEWQDGNRSA